MIRIQERSAANQERGTGGTTILIESESPVVGISRGERAARGLELVGILG